MMDGCIFGNMSHDFLLHYIMTMYFFLETILSYFLENITLSCLRHTLPNKDDVNRNNNLFCLPPLRIVYFPLSLTMATVDGLLGDESSSACTTGSASSPQSEVVTCELQELSLQPAPNLLPIHERKNGEILLLMC